MCMKTFLQIKKERAGSMNEGADNASTGENMNKKLSRVSYCPHFTLFVILFYLFSICFGENLQFAANVGEAE